MVDKSPHRIREMFDRISPTYDILNHALSLNSDIRWRRRAAALCAPAAQHPTSILDACCGTADLALELRRRWKCRVTGSDFSWRMLQYAQRKVHRRVCLSQADTLRLPFRNASFDACTVAFGLRNLSDTARGLGELTRVLKPGGRLVILEFTLPKPGLLRRSYLAYFNHVLPRVGSFVSRDRAYTYLNQSVKEWRSPEDLADLMLHAGLRDVAVEPLSFGVAAIHVGRKRP